MDDLTSADQDALADFAKRRDAESRRFYARRPKTAKDVMATVMNRRGYARAMELDAYQKVLCETVGDAIGRHIRVARLARGRLELVVANSAVMQEMTFHQTAFLKNLKSSLPESPITQLRFRIGTMDE